jgi:hypothetical protein
MNKMKEFLVIATQNSGCDYTIGCGVKTWHEYAKSLDDLKKKIKSQLLDEPHDKNGTWIGYEDEDYNYNGRLGGDEQSYDELDIYEITDSYSFDLDKLIEDKKDAKKRKEEEKKILAEANKDYREWKTYEALKKRFEGKEPPKKVTKPILSKTCELCETEFETKTKSFVSCKPCRGAEKKRIAEENLESMRVLEEKNGRVKQAWDMIAASSEWTETSGHTSGNNRGIYSSYCMTYNASLKRDNIKITKLGNTLRVQIWDRITPGKRKPSWRDSSYSEIEEKLSTEAQDYINEYPDIMYTWKI